MKYVLDSSVALKWVLPEPDSAKAMQLRTDSQKGVHELLALNIFYVEAAHALTRAERQRRIAVSAGWPLWRTIIVDCPALSDSYPLMRPRRWAVKKLAFFTQIDAQCLSISCSGIQYPIRLARMVKQISAAPRNNLSATQSSSPGW